MIKGELHIYSIFFPTLGLTLHIILIFFLFFGELSYLIEANNPNLPYGSYLSSKP